MASAGPVKSFNPSKGFGFIEIDGMDIFFHAADCGGNMPQQGDFVNFDAQESPSKPGTYVAKNVTGGTAGPPGAKGGGKGGGAVGVMGNGAHKARIKSFSQKNGFGFIDLDGQDVFVHVRDCVGGMPQMGDIVAFDLTDSPQKPGTQKAINVSGGTLPPGGGDMGDKGKGKGKDMGKGKDAWGGYGAAWDSWGGDSWSDPWSSKGWGKGPYDAWGGKGGDSWGKGGWGKGDDSWGKGKSFGKGKGDGAGGITIKIGGQAISS